jgi:hypothetical protein
MTSSQGIPGPTHYTNMHSDEEEDEVCIRLNLH